MVSKERITEFEAGERLDKTVAKLFPHYSRSALEKLIQNGHITVNNRSVKSKYVVKEGDVITADFSELEKNPEVIDLPVLYEDDDVVVINKPIGVLAHSKGEFNKEGTVATWLHNYVISSKVERSTSSKTDLSTPLRSAQDDEEFWKSGNRAGIVHRLDRATSGVMIVAKTEAAQKFLQKQFSQRKVKKTYYALINGTLDHPEGMIDIPIERNPKKPATFRAGANGKPAQTAFKVVSQGGKYSLIELTPKTGRTHQLRVHLAYLGHPIVGDEFYGGESAKRLFLHAATLEITLPSKERKIFQAPIPEDMKEMEH